MAFSLPNILTVARILLTPIFIILLLKSLYMAGLLVFSIAAVSDGLDGFLARYLDQRTTLGAYLDPIADKVLLMAAYVCLAILKIIPAWLAVIVISRDVVIVLGIGIISIAGLDLEIRPTMVSKLTTLAQLVTVSLTLLNQGVPGTAGVLLAPIFWLTAGLTVLSGLHYVVIGLNILQKGFED